MNLDNFIDAEQWAIEQWGDAALGDSRRTDRAVEIGAAIVANPGASLPVQMEGWQGLKAAYRLLNEEDVTHSALSQPHWQATAERSKHSGASVVLFIQDTTELDYTGHRSVEGLGQIGDGRGRGIMVHSCLAVVPTPGNPDILGLAGQIPWMRDIVASDLKTNTKKQKQRNEGDIWAEMIESIGQAPKQETGQIWVSVGDRGSDVFSYLRRSQALEWHCLLRVTQNRVITMLDGSKGYLKQLARSLESQAQKTIVLRGRDGEPQRSVQLQVAWESITIQPPAQGAERFSQPISGWCIRCWEEHIGKDALEWILFTTVAVSDAHSALEQLDWYACRWLIEEYHKCLKSGCAIEQRQLETAAGLLSLLGFLGIVAVRLLQLRTLSRSYPDAPARQFVPLLMLNVLVAKLGLFSNELTMSEFWQALARLGGFIGRKSDGRPGWQALWRGWARLQDMCCGAELAARTG